MAVDPLRPPARPAPDGRGPALEWSFTSHRWAVRAGVGTAAFFAVALTVTTGGFVWLGTWWIWVCAAVIAAALWWVAGSIDAEVGADWLRGARTDWVDLYDLTEIKCARSNTVEWVLRDRSGRRVRVSQSALDGNANMWPLVRNGFEHSLAAGASTNSFSRRRLSPAPPPGGPVA